MATWNAAFETTPVGGDSPSQGDDRIRELKTGVRERIEKEHMMNLLSGAAAADGWHKAGSAKAYVGSSAPTTRPDSSTALTADDDGRLWVSELDSKVRRFRYAAGSTMDERWEVVSSAGASGAAGINYDNTGFESGTTGYATYDDGASATPVDGTGGTAANLALTRSTVNPLIGLASGLLTKAAADAQGEGLSYDFTIDEGARLAPIMISFLYETSANYVDSDMGVYLYDKTNAVFIPISVVNILDSVGNPAKFEAAFLPNANSGSYRLIWHVQTTSALAYTFQLDSVSVSSQQIASGAAISVSQAYPLTIGATTTPPTKGTIVEDVATWARRGDKSLLTYRYKQSAAGSAGSGTYLYPLPPGQTIDLTKHPAGSVVGTFKLSSTTSDIAAESYSGVVIVYNATNLSLLFVQPTASTNVMIAHGSAGASLALSANLQFSYSAEVTVAEWTSNVNLASDFQEFVFNTQAVVNTNDTSSFGYGMGGAAILAHTATTLLDVSPVRALGPSDAVMLEVRSKVDGAWVSVEHAVVSAAQRPLSVAPAGNITLNGMGIQRPSAGVLRIQFGINATTTPTGGAISWASVVAAADGYDRWRVRIVRNGNMAEVPPLVFASYAQAQPYTGPGIGAPYNYATKREDTHNAVTTGAGWRFTAPIAGLYSVTGTIPMNSSSIVSIYKNGSEAQQVSYTSASGNVMPFAGQIRLAIGDYIEMRTANTGSIGSPYLNHIEIARIGA